MGKTSHLQIVSRLKAADKAYRLDLAKMAKEYQKEVLIPMCIDTGFSFFVCNGDYWFKRGELEVRDAWDADRQNVPFLKAYMTTLDLPDGLRGIFAHHMEDIHVPVPRVMSRLIKSET